ncbi:chaperone modulator CbpM [Gabonibacter chumensis]|uniref:chaperone modulator CbpM n=1 Tax=Gabonibacter chumensis TaxID=2972474 RepID=UPI00257363F9|nr:chaperone modulator CbpM [Gabonibacter chumensis]MCR9011077.1 chaperone modulator CbpM [Gabonibacter chumensis]
METDLIIVSEYCQKCHIDPSFIVLLEDGGLIDVRIIGDEHYLLLSQLQELERYTRMYYDLSINIEGIDAIRHLLERMKDMQNEMDRLKQELRVLRSGKVEYSED